MRKILVIAFLMFHISCFAQQSVYGFPLSNLEGGNINLSMYGGKRILFYTLPTIQNSSTDSSLYSLDSLGAAHVTDLIVVGVPSYEDGFTQSGKSALTQWYRSKLGAHILISDGIYVRKASGTQQHPLFKWLTTITLNDVFDIDAVGPGYKYFISDDGKLYGVLRPSSKISGRSVQTILQH